MYQLYQRQTLHAPLEKIWDFISHPANLNDITPPELDFEITSPVPDKMHNGLLIQYKVTLPLLGVSDWVTEIKHIIPNKQFIDEQRIGPYRFWYHFHGLEETENGVVMTDQVSYQPPYGILGKLVNTVLIRRQLDTIFDYRYNILEERFNGNR
ncbi:SRPBCC family protein [Aliifodinibius sp. S!AR15-10]|uniref:SRPBCC family protein n=1 Tax=Aliifodinibius sp. S!AR15-10 TaxID=2950437 RepID=UPI00286FE804|nr:SRPBCC family protein [Aliifodinibius sp. S!AR15-10]